MAGIPCKLFTPHVSWIRSDDVIIGWSGGGWSCRDHEKKTSIQNNRIQIIERKINKIECSGSCTRLCKCEGKYGGGRIYSKQIHLKSKSHQVYRKSLRFSLDWFLYDLFSMSMRVWLNCETWSDFRNQNGNCQSMNTEKKTLEMVNQNHIFIQNVYFKLKKW